ncbi:InlB B-repeat-containing protein [endosymbiont 'TC1' of Trimyema compressum]
MSQTVVEGSLITMPSTPTKEDLLFSGWFTDNGTFANEWNFSIAIQ